MGRMGSQGTHTKEQDRRQESNLCDDLYSTRSIKLTVFTMPNHVWENLLNHRFRLPTWLAPLSVAVLIFNIVTFPSGANALTVIPDTSPVLRHIANQLFPKSLVLTLIKGNPIASISLMAKGALNQKSILASKSFDLTRTRQAKISRVFRESLGVELWVTSWTAQKISYAESRNNCRDRSSNGVYLGKWQMDQAFWATYGGLRYASSADMATCQQQDQVAYNGWVSRHWQPWQTYSLYSH